MLDYATGASRTPVVVPDALFDRLRAEFDEAQLVELTNVIANMGSNGTPVTLPSLCRRSPGA